jgi:hypothetical protein
LKPSACYVCPAWLLAFRTFFSSLSVRWIVSFHAEPCKSRYRGCPQITRTRVAAVGSRQLSAWAMARPKSYVTAAIWIGFPGGTLVPLYPQVRIHPVTRTKGWYV